MYPSLHNWPIYLMILWQYGLRYRQPARPNHPASNRLLVHQLATLLRASFRPTSRLVPLRFASTSVCQPVQGLSPIKYTPCPAHCRALLRRVRNDGREWGIYLAIDKRKMAFPQPSLRDRSVREAAARMDCCALLRRARNDGKNIAS